MQARTPPHGHHADLELDISMILIPETRLAGRSLAQLIAEANPPGEVVIAITYSPEMEGLAQHLAETHGGEQLNSDYTGVALHIAQAAERVAHATGAARCAVLLSPRVPPHEVPAKARAVMLITAMIEELRLARNAGPQ